MSATGFRHAYNGSIAQILGLGDEMRVQNPKLDRTDRNNPKCKNPRWFIRPYIDTFDENGNLIQKQERVYIGLVSEVKKRDAITRKNEILAKINRRQYVVQSQLNFGEFLDHYEKEYVRKPGVLSASTQAKYLCHLKNHIRPAFAALSIAEAGDTKRIDAWLASKSKLSWSTRMDLRNLLCGIFTRAFKWGLWREANPAERATVGRQRMKREHTKLSVEDTRKLLDALPSDVRLICEMALFCGLRISEVMGLQWRHVDLAAGTALIEQRWYRGDLDVTKTLRSRRMVPLEKLADRLRTIYPGEGHGDEFVFSVRTHVGDWKKPGVCRDDRAINQHFLRPAAKKLGVYTLGFGFHSLRREAITEVERRAGMIQAQRLAGHSKADMTMHYGLASDEQRAAVRAWQTEILGTAPMEQQTTGSVN